MNQRVCKKCYKFYYALDKCKSTYPFCLLKCQHYFCINCIRYKIPSEEIIQDKKFVKASHCPACGSFSIPLLIQDACTYTVLPIKRKHRVITSNKFDLWHKLKLQKFYHDLSKLALPPFQCFKKIINNNASSSNSFKQPVIPSTLNRVRSEMKDNLGRVLFEHTVDDDVTLLEPEIPVINLLE